MDIIEHHHVRSFLKVLDGVKVDENQDWLLVAVKRELLKPITNEALSMVIRPSMQNSSQSHIFFPDPKTIYVLFTGNRQTVYRHLRAVIMSSLVRSGISGTFMTYVDPRVNYDAIQAKLLGEPGAKTDALSLAATQDPKLDMDDPFGWNSDKVAPLDGPTEITIFDVTKEQMHKFNETRDSKAYRKSMQILVVEDHIFFQKLISEMIRAVRVHGKDSPTLDLADGIKSAWTLFLKKAHDMVFIDLGLADGSGHALARAIKEIDPTASVIIVTANNQEEELGVAQQNNVDGFIVKPYSKKQILACFQKHAPNAKIWIAP